MGRNFSFPSRENPFFRIQVTVTGLSLDRIIGTPWRALYISRFTLKLATPLLFTLLHMFIRCDHLMFSKYFFRKICNLFSAFLSYVVLESVGRCLKNYKILRKEFINLSKKQNFFLHLTFFIEPKTRHKI